ncbi:hypothetical protein LTR53_016703 [Teratosphaeriaceae sp. CCFEE 6253]|nr:hypothetical protein LTR53_016703 [Teratosphaeriaceae sp. CCFEE 6253]
MRKVDDSTFKCIPLPDRRAPQGFDLETFLSASTDSLLEELQEAEESVDLYEGSLYAASESSGLYEGSLYAASESSGLYEGSLYAASESGDSDFKNLPPGLAATATEVYWTIDSLFGEGHEPDYFDAGTIARSMRKGRKVVQTALLELKDFGLVKQSAKVMGAYWLVPIEDAAERGFGLK